MTGSSPLACCSRRRLGGIRGPPAGEVRRVKTAVRDLRKAGVDARWYRAWGKNFPPPGVRMTPAQLNAALARNERWLRSKIKQGYQIFDIGPQAGRPTPSDFYKLEQSILRATGYPSTPLPGY